MRYSILMITDFFKYEFPLLKQDRIFKRGYIQMVERTCYDAYKAMASKSLSYPSVRGYIAHLPVKGKDGYYPTKAFKLSSECLNTLWEYSKEMKYIDNACSFEDFLYRRC